ncbi:Pentatricopeptide repeat-containing protein [Nymphaea thermarum]|nr:Pentatricopeptide repeat-containing protein [Nymphaea thermarum]
MYSKCGCLDSAYQVSEKMPQRDVVAWNSMAAGCALHGLYDDIMDSTTSGANASSSVSANNIEVDIFTKTKSLRSAAECAAIVVTMS